MPEGSSSPDQQINSPVDAKAKGPSWFKRLFHPKAPSTAPTPTQPASLAETTPTESLASSPQPMTENNVPTSQITDEERQQNIRNAAIPRPLPGPTPVERYATSHSQRPEIETPSQQPAEKPLTGSKIEVGAIPPKTKVPDVSVAD